MNSALSLRTTEGMARERPSAVGYARLVHASGVLTTASALFDLHRHTKDFQTYCLLLDTAILRRLNGVWKDCVPVLVLEVRVQDENGRFSRGYASWVSQIR